MATEEKFTPYAGVDETVDAAASAAVVKAFQPPGRLFLMGIMAGIFIGIGFWLAVTVSSAFWTTKVTGFDAATHKLVTEPFNVAWPLNPSAMMKFLLGAVFPVGLIAVCIGGAELWTGCANVIPLGYMQKKLKLKALIYNWVTAYGGNWVGSVFLAFLATYGSTLLLASPFRDELISVVWAKVNLSPWEAFWRGVGCNFLVNLAIWLWLRSKKGDFMGQAFLIWFPIFTFVTIGFEHSIANMFLIPAAIFASPLALKQYIITYYDFFFNNLLPVTYGNLVGGFVFIALVYWYVGMVKGSKYGEATPTDALKYAAEILLLAGIVHHVLEVAVPGAIAVAVEKALGLSAGINLTNAGMALIPAVITGIYYALLPFIVYKALKPLK
ncbi:formate/nitrite transporter family protein [Thermofilum pendens]|uniref:Formate/nitrite transporter n=1 Tax=Thermofilum pendens (strain DSM 2475 / Hrk 5) TaxID=368408 RepID=A1RWM1_THEPD|nr:formate/nitrite transporter family protein [Thermofilum pendens]ABL77601.1 formate/nitrite transporter [Thermofilum pendens Hrk 5]